MRAYLDDRLCGETQLLFQSPDVAEKLGTARDAHIGFRMLGRIDPFATEPRDVTLRVVASWDDGTSSTLAEQPVRLVPAVLAQRPYGEVVYPGNETLLHRENIYGSGPPIEDRSRSFQSAPGVFAENASSWTSAAAPALRASTPASGHNWLAWNPSPLLRDPAAAPAPFRRVDLESRQLPCADGEWDSAICIEVSST